MRSRRALSLRPVNSVKNIQDSTQIGVTGGTNASVSIAAAVNAYSGAVNEVPIGAKVNAVYLFVQIACDSTTANVDWYIGKFPSGLTLPNPGSTGGNVYRRYILHEGKGLPGNYAAGSSPLTFEGVIRIPKGRKRFAEGDAITFVARGGSQFSLCVKAIYKFFQ